MISKGWVGQNTFLALTTEVAVPSPVYDCLCWLRGKNAFHAMVDLIPDARQCHNSIEARATIMPFLMSSVLLLIAMRHCTDALFARLRHSLCIEIGGAMTADTPPQQIKEAA